MNKKVSLAFTLLTAYCLLNLTNIFRNLGILFSRFSVGGILSFLISLATILLPFALLALLYLNTKKDVKKAGALVCLAGAVLKAYSVFTNIKSMITMLLSGSDFFIMLNSVSNLIFNLSVALLFFFAYRHISTGKKSPYVKVVAGAGGFCYFFASALILLMSSGAVSNMLAGLLLIMALVFLPATVADYSTATMTSGTNLKIVVAVLALALLIPAIAGSAGSGSSSRNDDLYNSVSGEPWKDLGVSKREYMEIYNKYKYGE